MSSHELAIAIDYADLILFRALSCAPNASLPCPYRTPISGSDRLKSLRPTFGWPRLSLTNLPTSELHGGRVLKVQIPWILDRSKVLGIWTSGKAFPDKGNFKAPDPTAKFSRQSCATVTGTSPRISRACSRGPQAMQQIQAVPMCFDSRAWALGSLRLSNANLGSGTVRQPPLNFLSRRSSNSRIRGLQQGSLHYTPEHCNLSIWCCFHLFCC